MVEIKRVDLVGISGTLLLYLQLRHMPAA